MINLGIIGPGAVVHRHHWPVLQKLADQIQVVAVAGRNPRNAARFAKLAGARRSYADYRELLHDPEVDAVFTAVPIELNGPVLLASVRSDKHVLAEKPIAATPQEARRILKECSRRRSVVAVAENYRYRHDLLKARQLLKQGKIGDVFAFQINVKFDLDAKARRIWISRNWRKDARHHGGFLLDAGVHPISALHDLLGPVSELDAYVTDVSPVLKGPDSLLLQLKLASGVVGQCFFCYTAKEEKESGLDFAVFGTRGSLRVGEGEVAWSSGVGHRRVYQITGFDRGYLGQWRNFCNAILGKEPLISTPQKAYNDVVVIDAALRSAKSRRRVRLD
jgi:predicted dehydrogenase